LERTFIPHVFPKLTESSLNGIRIYNLDGSDLSFPSVTSVLNAVEPEGIKKWKQRVGQEAADAIKNQAATRGTWLHKLNENYFLGNKPDLRNPAIAELFLQIRPELEKINNIHAMESALFSRKLRSAGRTDMIAEYNGKLSIIDFKTSTKVKVKGSDTVDKYFVQTAAYAQMFDEMFGIQIPNLVLIIATDDDLRPTVFEQENDDRYIDKFLAKRDEFEVIHGF